MRFLEARRQTDLRGIEPAARALGTTFERLVQLCNASARTFKVLRRARGSLLISSVGLSLVHIPSHDGTTVSAPRREQRQTPDPRRSGTHPSDSGLVPLVAFAFSGVATRSGFLTPLRLKWGRIGAVIGRETRGIRGKRRDAKPQLREPFALIAAGSETASIGLENR